MKKSYIERAMRMAEILSSYMEKYNEAESIYRKCQMATQEYNNRHKHSSMASNLEALDLPLSSATMY